MRFAKRYVFVMSSRGQQRARDAAMTRTRGKARKGNESSHCVDGIAAFAGRGRAVEQLLRIVEA